MQAKILHYLKFRGEDVTVKLGHYLEKCVFFFFFPLLFRAALVAYGSSQAGVELELQLPAHTTVTATPDLSQVCDLYHSSWQSWILNPLSEARDQICVLMVTSQIHFC